MMKAISGFILLGMFSQASFAYANAYPPAYVDCPDNDVDHCTFDSEYLITDKILQPEITPGRYYFYEGETFTYVHKLPDRIMFTYAYKNDKGEELDLDQITSFMQIDTSDSNSQWQKYPRSIYSHCGPEVKVEQCPFTNLPY